MDRYREKHPIVINEEILREAVKKEVVQIKETLKETVKINVSEGFIASCFECKREVLHLSLENKNILKIDRLYDFTSLVRLDLNNNKIEKVEGLEALINLTSLDLSFNKIKKIEGLETLQKLEVLNLSYNQITLFENMDTLENLRLLFIGNNHISELDNVRYLARFKKLFRLYMTENPVSNKEDFTLFTLAFLPNLTYLDTILIDLKTRKEAAIKYQVVLEKMKHEELQKQQAVEAQQSQEAELKLHHDAFVQEFNGSSLFTSMFKDDPEAVKPQFLPQMAPVLQSFEEQMVNLCRCFIDFGLAELKQREAELNDFQIGQNEAEAYYKQKTAETLAEFDQEHKERIAELQNLTDSDLFEVKINSCNDAITQLQKMLLTVEFDLMSSLEENIAKLKNFISDKVHHFLETAQETFNQFRDLEDKYHQNVQEIAVETQETVANENLENDVPEDVRKLLTDTDLLTKALKTSHENHLQWIEDRENQLIFQVAVWKTAFFKEIQEKDVQRKHVRFTNIHRYVDFLRKQMGELALQSIAVQKNKTKTKHAF